MVVCFFNPLHVLSTELYFVARLVSHLWRVIIPRDSIISLNISYFHIFHSVYKQAPVPTQASIFLTKSALEQSFSTL